MENNNLPFDSANRAQPLILGSLSTPVVVAINLGIMLLYLTLTAVFATPDKFHAAGEGADALLITMHSALTLFGGLKYFFEGNRPVGFGLMGSSLLIATVGFALCMSKCLVFG